MQAVDFYKMLHQGVYGPSHLTNGISAARDRLLREIEELRTRRAQKSPGSTPLPPTRWEPLDTAGHLIRINLLPIIDSPQQLEKLVSVLAESAVRLIGSPSLLADRMAAAARWSEGMAPHLAAPIEQIAARAAAAGYPPLHHSATYRRLYQPAYRVVLAELW